MGRKINFSPAVGTAPASGGTSRINASELVQGPVVADIIRFTGAATYADVTGLRVFAGSVPFINVYGAGLPKYSAMIQRLSRNNAAPLATAHFLPIYYYALDEKDQNARDNYQSPMNRYIEVDFGTFTASGEGMDVVTILTDQPTLYYPSILEADMGIAASQALRNYDPKQSGYLRGFGIDIDGATGLLRLFWTLSGVQLYNGITGVALQGQELAEQGVAGDTSYSADPLFVKVNPWYDMSVVDNMIQLQTGAGWAGTTNSFLAYTVTPVGKATIGTA